MMTTYSYELFFVYNRRNGDLISTQYVTFSLIDLTAVIIIVIKTPQNTRVHDYLFTYLNEKKKNKK